MVDASASPNSSLPRRVSVEVRLPGRAGWDRPDSLGLLVGCRSSENIPRCTSVRMLRGIGLAAEVCGLASRLSHARGRAWSQVSRTPLFPAASHPLVRGTIQTAQHQNLRFGLVSTGRCGGARRVPLPGSHRGGRDLKRTNEGWKS